MGDLRRVAELKGIKTRRQEKEDKRREKFKRSLLVKFKVGKFTNPYSTYKIFEVALLKTQNFYV